MSRRRNRLTLLYQFFNSGIISRKEDDIPFSLEKFRETRIRERGDDTFRERRPVYRAYSRGCGLINDLFDSSLSSTLRARMPRIERTIEFYVNTLVQERKPGSSA